MRMTSNYKSVRSAKGSCGIKVIVPHISGAIPGTKIFKLDSEDQEFTFYESKIELDDDGIAVFAPTMGQLEALLFHLREEVVFSI
jgi:translation initiation factor IF-2